MRKNQKLVLFVTLVLLCVLCMTIVLSACDLGKDDSGSGSGGNSKPTPPGGGDGGDPPPIDPEEPETGVDSGEVLKRIINGVKNAGDTMQICIEAEASVLDTATKKRDTYVISLRGALDPVEDVQLALRVEQTERQGTVLPQAENIVSLFVDRDKVYAQVGAQMYLLSDVDSVALGTILQDIIENGLPIDLPDLPSFDDIVDLFALVVFPFLAPGQPTVVNNDDGSVTYVLGMDFKYFFTQLDGIVTGLIGSLLPIDLELGQLMQFIANSIPDISSEMRATFDSSGYYVGNGLEFDVIDTGYQSDTNGENLYRFRASMGQVQGDVDVGMPEFEQTEIDVFSLTNLQFNIDLMLGSKNAQGEIAQFDVGQMVNIFTGAQTLPEGLIMLETDYGVRLSVKIDLDVNFFNRPDPMDPADNNLIAIELFQLDSNGNVTEEKPMAGVYYYDKAAYISLDNILPNAWNLRTIKVNTNLDAVLDMISNYCCDAIDSFLNRTATQSAAMTAAGGPVYGSGDVISKDDIIPTNTDGDGNRVISPFASEFFAHLIAVLPGLEEFVNIGGEDGNTIRFLLNNDLLEYINSLVLAFSPQSGGFDFRLPKGIDSAELTVNLDPEIGVDNMRVHGVLKDANGTTLDAKLEIGDFLIGLEDENLQSYVQSCVNSANGTATSKLADVIKHALGMDNDPEKESGLLFTLQFKFGFNKGTYDLAPFIAGFGVDALKDKHILWTFTEDFTFNTEMTVQISLDEQDHSKSVIYIDLKSTSGIYIGDIELMGPDTSILTITGVNNSLHVDMTNIQIAKIHLPKVKVDMDFTQLILDLLFAPDPVTGEYTSALGKLDLTFDLAAILEGLLNNGNTDVETQADVSKMLFGTDDPEARIGDAELTDAGKIFVGLNSESLMLSASVQAVLGLLSKLNINLDTEKMPSLKTIDADLTLNGSRKGGIVLDMTNVKLAPAVKGAVPGENGTVQLPIGEDGQPVYEYDYDALGMSIHMETGNEPFPIQIGNITQWRKDLTELTQGSYDEYTDQIMDLLASTLGSADFNIKINLSTLDQQLNLTRIINQILASQGMSFDLPINLNFDRWDQVYVDLVLRWNVDLENMINTQFLAEFVYNDKLLFGVYMYRGSVVVDLRGLGLFNFEITNSTLVPMITGLIEEQLNKLGGMSLSEIIGNLLNPAQEVDLTESVVKSDKADPANGIVTTIDPVTLADAQAQEGEVMDWIGVILSGVSGFNANITLAFGAQMVDEIFRNFLGFGLGIDIGLEGQINAIEGKLSFGVKVEDIDLKIDMQMEVGEKLNMNISLADVVDWDMDNSRGFVEDIFDNLNIGFMVDIANSTSITNSIGNQYTRLTLERVLSRRVLPSGNGATAEAGEFLITLSDVNYDRYVETTKGTSSPRVYIVYNHKTASMRLVIASGWLKINLFGGIDLAGMIGAQTIPNVDLVGMLAQALVPVFFPDEQPATVSEDPALATASMATADPAPTDELMAAISALFDPAQGGMNILDMFSEGINISLRSTGVFNVDAQLEDYMFNRTIDSLMDLIFGNNSKLDLSKLAPTMFTQHHLRKVTWSRFNPDTFWNSFVDALPALVKDVLNNIGQGALAGLITPTAIGWLEGSLKGMVTKLIPLPIVNDIHVGLNIVNGTFANIYVNAYDNNETVQNDDGEVWGYGGNQYTAASGSRLAYQETASGVSGYFTEIWVYNTSSAVGKWIKPGDGSGMGTEDPSQEQGVVDWGEISRIVEFEPYEYPALTEQVGGVQVAKKMLLEEYFYNKMAKYQNGTRVAKTPIQFKVVGKYNVDLAGNVIGEMSPLDMKVDDIDLSQPALYQIQATAQFEADIGTKQFDMQLLINGSGTITSVGEMLQDGSYREGIASHAYDELPEYFTIELDQGGEKYYRQIRTDRVQFSEYQATAYTEHEVHATVQFANGVKVGPTYDQSSGALITPGVRILYADSTVQDIFGGIMIPIDLYSLKLPKTQEEIQKLLDRYIPQYLYFTYADGFNGKQAVTRRPSPEDPEYIAFYNALIKRQPDDASGGQYSLTLYIGEGALEQAVRMTISIRTKEINKMVFGDLENEVRIDPYAYYLYTATGDESLNPFPSQVDVTYYQEYNDVNGEPFIDSYTEKVSVKWDYDQITQLMRWDTENDISGSIRATVALNKDLLDENGEPVYSGDFNWMREVGVILARNEIKSIYFDERMRPQDKTLYIDPYVFAGNLNRLGNPVGAERLVNFPSEAWVEFTNGSVLRLPIAWQKNVVESWDPNYSGTTNQFRVTIGHDDAAYRNDLTIAELPGMSGMLQSKNVKVVVENKVIDGIYLPGSEFYDALNMTQSYYYIDPLQYQFFGADALPQSVEAYYADGTKTTLDVTWAGWEDGDDEELLSHYTITGSGETYYTVTAKVSDNVSFPIKVKFRSRDMADSEIFSYNQEITLNPYTYTKSGNTRKYAEFGDKISVTYTEGWTLTYVNKANKVQKIEFAQYDKDKMLATKAQLESEGYAVEMTVNKKSYDLAVTWDLSSLNYAQAGDYTVYAILTNAANRQQLAVQKLPITVHMDYRKLVGVAIAPYVENADGTIQLDESGKPVMKPEGEQYSFPIALKGADLTAAERALEYATRELTVFFYDKTISADSYVSVKMQVRISLAGIDFNSVRKGTTKAYISFEYADMQQEIDIRYNVYDPANPVLS